VLVVTAARFGSGGRRSGDCRAGGCPAINHGGTHMGVGYLLGPLAVGITSATGIVTAGVRHWSKRRAVLARDVGRGRVTTRSD
jgi:hypothetical protein